jgi:hypothetical protein
MRTSTREPRARTWPIVLVAAGCLLLGSTGGAVAGSLITGKDVKNGSLTGKDVKDKSLGSDDLSPEAVSALRGASGAPGAPGLNAYQALDGAQKTVVSGGDILTDLACPSGTTVLGADIRVVSGTAAVTSGGPTGGGTWQLELVNPTAGDAIVVPYIICTRP